mgnify:CR=1 FL=1
MINYAAVAVAALEALQHLLKDLAAGKVTIEDALLRIAALKSGRAAVDAEMDAAALAKFSGGNKPGI